MKRLLAFGYVALLVFSYITLVLPSFNERTSNTTKISYKNSNDVLSDTTCVSPTAGCGTNYYWDSSSCSCQFSGSGGSCISPSAGCGTNYYWDSGSCSCKPSTSGCVSPSAGCGTGYSWDSGSCTCKANTTSCVSPVNGCGTGYSWDSSNCYCRPNTTSCVSPSNGCGGNYYWDSSSCTCKVNTTTCVSPINGCGSGYYWDSTSCYCRTSTTTCVSPTYGCGTNYYWDSSSCTCKVNTTTCVSPINGCGTGYYWDSTSCYCKPSTTNCVSPTYGCGSGYYWDSGNCYCKPQTASAATITPGTSYCSPPSAGCGYNYYWDSTSCSCKYYYSTTTSVTPSSCTAPGAGCGTNYYWDSSNCYCRPSNTTNICSAPQTGCGTGWFWDQPSCSCKSTTDPQTYYSVALSSNNTGSNQYMDRLSYESPERIVCIKSFLTDTEFQKLRYFIPVTESDYKDLSVLGDKTKSCWQSVTNNTSVSGSSGSPSTSASPVTVDKCLSVNLGEKAYTEIYQGSRPPTYEEHLVFDKCNGARQQDSVTFLTKNQEVPDVTQQCLKNVLGSDIYSKVKNGKADVPPDLRKSVDKCFGVDPQPFAQGSIYKIPNEIKSCLLTSLGEEKFNEINSGKTNPTNEDKNKAEKCFSELNKTEQKFLPPPPESVHYLTVDTGSVNLSDIRQNQDDKKKIMGGKVVINGKGLPNSNVYIYIFSEPIVVTTKTDENGEWVYELNQPLSGEKHIAYATVKNSSGKLVRSSVFNFTVIAAETDLSNNFINEAESVKPIQQNLIYYYLFISVCAIIAAIGIFYVFFIVKLNKYAVKEGNSEGQNNNERGPGPIN